MSHLPAFDVAPSHAPRATAAHTAPPARGGVPNKALLTKPSWRCCVTLSYFLYCLRSHAQPAGRAKPGKVCNNAKSVL